MSTERFFHDLPPKTEFLETTDPRNFTLVPEDWWIACADVRDSTSHVEARRYREVNLVGAAVIIALLNIDRDLLLPFAFGGDGASVLIPSSMVERARDALIATRAVAKREFELDLRVGLFPISQIHADGHYLRVAKVRIGDVYDQAMFSGGGLSHAEKLLKLSANELPYTSLPEPASYEGLECRWKYIESRHGEIVSIVTTPTSGDPDRDAEINFAILSFVAEVYGDADECNPVRVEDLHESFDFGRLEAEAKIRVENDSPLERSRYTFNIWAGNWMLKYFVNRNIQTGDVNWRRYLDLLVATTDFRKYDDGVRLVLSGTAAQRAQFEAYLEAQYQDGLLAYGVHVSDKAQITCAVFERMGRQVHFVDGVGGGLTQAAKAMKERMRNRQAQLTTNPERAPTNSAPIGPLLGPLPIGRYSADS